jgi:hypothetical protein
MENMSLFNENTALENFLGSPSQHMAKKKFVKQRKSDTRFRTATHAHSRGIRQEQEVPAAAPASTSTAGEAASFIQSFIHSNALAERAC